ncbi:cupin domain-containing protein [Leucobacter denitrificans]|uniref:Cupin domain-containing protein n=1 Tax=Leucobacter denitrificans TaxID=683042 RepID=A0A7G9S230_9MICO|nr:cupin domain-containing protein [Leucobacter denitrificans]QNN61905.1 cupin domain-containing protein [Leucobacter denitrificans]
MTVHVHMAEAVDPEADEQRALGSRLRALRKAKHMPLREVARLAEVSESFLSQIERGLTSPSISSLRRICVALGENMGALFNDAHEPQQVDQHLVRFQDRRRIFRPDGSANYLITPKIAKDLEIHHNVIAPGRSSGAEPYSHQGNEECVLVLEGRLHFEWNGNPYDLGPGDAILIDPKLDHSFSNNTDENAVVLWVISSAQNDI